MEKEVEATIQGLGILGESNGKEHGKLKAWGYIVVYRDSGFLILGIPFYSLWEFILGPPL